VGGVALLCGAAVGVAPAIAVRHGPAAAVRHAPAGVAPAGLHRAATRSDLRVVAGHASVSGRRASGSVTVQNVGAAPAPHSTAAVLLRAVRIGVVLSTFEVPRLASGHSATINLLLWVPARLAAMPYSLVACARYMRGRNVDASDTSPACGDCAKVLNALADVETHFNIDRRRVLIGGYSSGGDMASGSPSTTHRSSPAFWR
jgi:hypothetical protein